MILRLLLLACAVVGTYSLGGMLSAREFKDRIEQNCFQNDDSDPFLINGQENPLSNSIENFISLAEKFEAANPSITLRDELYYFIRNYIFENIKLTTEGIGTWAPDMTTFSETDIMWEPDMNYRESQQRQQFNLPFSESENCSLYFMISHSIVDKRSDVSELRSSGKFNRSSENFQPDIVVDEYFPQEIGVVAIRESDEAVSLGRVLIGLYVGLNQNRKKELQTYDRIAKQVNDIREEIPSDTLVDPLYALTLAEVTMLSAWTKANRRGFAQNGRWLSFPKEIESFCPMVYKHETTAQAYSFASLRGAQDGLILGSIVHSIESKKITSKVSQILRMYYSREGIAVEQGTSMDIQMPKVSFCSRQEVIDPFNANLETQMQLYGFLVSSTLEMKKTFDIAKTAYNLNKDLIYKNKDILEYCGIPLVLENSEDLTRETNLDVIVVMDTSVAGSGFVNQQKITGYLLNSLDLRYTASRMSIFLDQSINSGSGSAKIELHPVVSDEYSTSCAACTVGQIIQKVSNGQSYANQKIERDQVILALDQLIDERKSNESNLHGANGKVVVYFNFDSNGGARDNNRVQGKVDSALRDFYLRHPDVNFYAVGLDTETLKRFSRNDNYLVELSADGNEKDVAERLYKKISGDPGLLQYPDCEKGSAESSAIYENFVSPYAIQHWEMPAKYFYKSRGLKVVFESTNGVIKVCHNRATMKPENEAKFCNVTAANRGVEFRLSNPCKGLNEKTCSPFYFAVIGMNTNGDTNSRPRDTCNDINDKWCNKLDSIKFRVSHEGIRCSGCLGLGAYPMMVLLTVLSSYILHKMF